MLVLDYPPQAASDSANWEIAEQALTDAVAATGERAVIVSTLPETMPADVRARLKAAGITPMQGLEECLFAIRAAVMIGRTQNQADQVLPVMEPAPIHGDVATLDEWQSKADLAKFGLRIPDGKLCNRDETSHAAEALGFPVVLKAVCADVAHKSDVGAVVVNLGNAKAVADATATMAETFDRFLLEKMAGPTVVELIVGVSRDETFGLTILLGAGGTLVELLDDTTTLLLPVQRHEIVAAIRALKVARLIDSYRGSGAGDFDAVVDAVTTIAEYAVQNSSELAELDVNPLIVLSEGAIAVDAYIRKSNAQENS